MKKIIFLLGLLMLFGLVSLSAQIRGEFNYLSSNSPTISDFEVVGIYSDTDGNGVAVADIVTDGTLYFIDATGQEFQIVGKTGNTPLTLRLDTIVDATPVLGLGQITPKTSRGLKYTTGGINDKLERIIANQNTTIINSLLGTGSGGGSTIIEGGRTIFHQNITSGGDYTLPIDTFGKYDIISIYASGADGNDAVITLPDIGDVDSLKGKQIVVRAASNGTGNVVVTSSDATSIVTHGCPANTQTGPDTLSTSERPILVEYYAAFSDNYYRFCETATVDFNTITFDSRRPILSTPEVGDSIGGTLLSTFLENAFFFTPPDVTLSKTGGTNFEVGTTNSITLTAIVNNPAGTGLSNGVTNRITPSPTTAVSSWGSANNDAFVLSFTPRQGGSGNFNEPGDYIFRAQVDWAGAGSTGTVQSGTQTIRGLYPVFYGMASTDTTTVLGDIYGTGTLTKLVTAEGNKTLDFTGSGLIYYAFPASWSDNVLSGITDPTNLPVITSFTRTTATVTSTGLDGNYTNVPYIVYYLNTGTTVTSNSTYIFTQ